MRKLAVLLILLIVCAGNVRVQGQAAAEAPKAAAVTSEKKTKKTAAEKENKSSTAKLFGQPATGLDSNAPTLTEIYADEAFFDSTKNMGIFSGRVKVTDPRFNLQCDKIKAWRKLLPKGTLGWCATDLIPMAGRRRALLVGQTKPFIQQQLAMLN